MSDLCAQLRTVLGERFSEGELRALLADLALNYEDLPGSSKLDRAREAVAWFQRRRELGRLVASIEAARPDIDLGGGGPIIGCQRVRVVRRRRTMPDVAGARMGANSGTERAVERLAESMDNVKNELGQLRTDVRLLQADMVTVKAQVKEIDECVRTGAPMSRQTTLTVLFGITSILMAAAVIFMAVWR